MRIARKPLLAVWSLFALTIAKGAYAQAAPNVEPLVPADAAIARAATAFINAEATAGRFSGVVVVARGGTPIVELARGEANRNKNVANTIATRFQLASGDKWFTKIAISQLVAEGKIALTDTVGKFLPTYPNATVRSKVTVQQLLLHRSGMSSYFNAAYEAKRKTLRTLEDVVALFSGEQLAFTPGESSQYSNNGYVILGRIIEVASGSSYYDYVQRRIFTPTGMSRTTYLTLDEWPADKAIGYASGAENTGSLAYRGSSAGGGYSTATDLLNLDGALRRGAVGDTSVLSRITARAPGGRLIIANGGGAGANVEIGRVGEYSIIVLTNLDPPAATSVLTHITGLLQPRAATPTPAAMVAPATDTPVEARAEVERLNASMMEAFHRNDPLAVAAHYTDDARIIGPRGPAIEGRTAVNAYWTGFPSEGRTWKLDVIDVGGTRDLVYQRGRSTISGGARSQTVDWIGIWRRQPDGQLKLAVDYWVPTR